MSHALLCTTWLNDGRHEWLSAYLRGITWKKNSIDQTTIWGVSDNATLLHSTEIKHTVIFSNMIFGSLHSNCKSYLYSFNIFGRAAEWSYSRYASFYLTNRNLWNESWKEMREVSCATRCLVAGLSHGGSGDRSTWEHWGKIDHK